MKLAKKCFLFFIILCCQLAAMAQPIERRFVNFSLEDGLSQSVVLDIKQDQFGYTWIATADGLNVFNGADFEVFKKNPADTNSLSDNFVYAILPLSDGLVWAITQDRIINEIDIKTKKVKRFSPIGEIAEAMYAANQMMLGPNGNIWITAENQGIIVLNRKGKVIKKINVQSGLIPSNNVNSIFLGNKYIWICTDNGLARVTNDLGNVKMFYPNQNIGAAHQFKNQLYLSFFNKIKTLECDINNPEKVLNIIPIDHAITCFASQKNGTLWLGSEDHGIFELYKGTLNNYTHNQSDKWSLIDNDIFSIYSDLSDNIWIGTNNGLSIYKTAYNPFKLIRASENSLSSNKIYDIYEDAQNNIWFINYEGGLDLLSEGLLKKIKPNGLNGSSIRSIYQSKNGDYFCGTVNGGLYQFFPEIERFQLLTTTADLALIRKIKERNQKLYIAHSQGVAIYDLTNKTLTPNIITKEFTGYDLFLDNNYLYVATFAHGLFVINLSNAAYQNFKYSAKSNSISSDNIMSIVQISADTLALGTYGGGVSLFNKKNQTFNSFSEADGLKNNSVYGIIPDRENNLWLSTNAGIIKWYADRKTVKNYDLPIQLQSLEFNEDAFLKTRNGVFYFGGVNGVNYFNPQEILKNTISPNAIITKILVGEKLLNFNEINKANIQFKAKENDLQFFFSAIKLAVPEKTKFSYKLEGLETEWREVSGEKYIRYNNLPSGSYTFMIKACNEDGICDTDSQSFAFTIATPFYKTIWFLSLVGFSILGLGYYFYTSRTNNLRKEYAAKMTNAELRALRIQMNPHFIFNSLNSIQYYILNADAKTAYKYLTKFSALMRRTLQHSKENFLPLKEEIESVKIYLELENMRLENSLEVEINIDSAIEIDKTLLPTLFIQPFAENAILHGLIAKEGPKKITIGFNKTAKGIQCIIEDNGIGRNAAAELNKQRNRSHQSTALNAIENRIKILNDSANFKISMEIEDLQEGNKATGTRVILNIG